MDRYGVSLERHVAQHRLETVGRWARGHLDQIAQALMDDRGQLDPGLHAGFHPQPIDCPARFFSQIQGVVVLPGCRLTDHDERRAWPQMVQQNQRPLVIDPGVDRCELAVFPAQERFTRVDLDAHVCCP